MPGYLRRKARSRDVSYRYRLITWHDNWIATWAFGGGGSILTVPALVYLVGQPPQIAVTTSLAIVGTNSAVGAIFHSKQGTLNWNVALLFGGAGMGMAYLSAGLSDALSQTTLLITFAILMLIIGLLMLFRNVPQNRHDIEIRWSVVLASGIGVGLLTGFLGVGGGFLIVPALVMLLGLPIQQAVGTSLVIIAMNSIAGFIGHLGSDELNIQLTLIVAGAGVGGTFLGAKLGKHLQGNQLRQLFAIFVLMLAVLLLYDNLRQIL